MFHFSLSSRAIPLATKLSEHRHDIISFGAGDAFPGLLPDLTAEAQVSLTEHRAQTLQYGARAGIPQLREWVARHICDQGIEASAANILIVNGAKQGLDLISLLLTEKGDRIAVGAPTYHTSIPIFRSHGLGFTEFSHDAEGIDAKAIRAEFAASIRQDRPLPRFIYEVPDFQNPTGVTMSLKRRQELIDIASEFQVPIVEDSPYRQVRFSGEAVPPLKSLDRTGAVFHVGTFAKLLAPGLRIGWIATTPENVARLGLLKADGGACPLTQRMVYEFGASGKLDRHIEKVARVYKHHMQVMVDAVERHIPQLSFVRPEGGYYMWARLPAGISSTALAAAALEMGVEIIPGTRFYAEPTAKHPSNFPPGSDCIRLGYTFASPDQIEEGVLRLAQALAALDTGN